MKCVHNEPTMMIFLFFCLCFSFFSKVHILGSFQNIRIARNAICSLILGESLTTASMYTNTHHVAHTCILILCIGVGFAGPLKLHAPNGPLQPPLKVEVC